MIFLSVGTFLKGFDALVDAADHACHRLGVPGFAQIGHSAVIPQHLQWQRFLAAEDMQRLMAGAELVVCHGGMGVIGDAMRAGRPILAVPRQGATSRDNPANDQRGFVERMARQYGIGVCEDLRLLGPTIARMLQGPRQVDYRLGSDVPMILGEWLRRTTPATPRARPQAPPDPGRDAA